LEEKEVAPHGVEVGARWPHGAHLGLGGLVELT